MLSRGVPWLSRGVPWPCPVVSRGLSRGPVLAVPWCPVVPKFVGHVNPFILVGDGGDEGGGAGHRAPSAQMQGEACRNKRL